MKAMMKLKAKAAAERGASLVEYALLVALIAVVCIAALTFLGNNSSDTMDKAGTATNEAGADENPSTTTPGPSCLPGNPGEHYDDDGNGGITGPLPGDCP